jgi:Mrp family chromosome partitioning ATPase
MLTKEAVKKSLDRVLVPGVKRSLVMMNLVRSIDIADRKVSVTLASSALGEGARGWLKAAVSATLEKLPDASDIQVEFTEVKPAEVNQIQNVIAIMSGKGGVGKSLVASLVAVALKRQGAEVGILDADITGPSIPTIFGISERPGGSETGIMPVLSRSGIEVMSFNLLLPRDEDAVIWRGPLIARAITQFWEEVVWGKLDYLVVDLPPGTADAPLTVLQTLPVSGIIIVFTPQGLTATIVKKAVNMAQKMDKPILGVIENMSYLYLAEVDKRFEIFGKSKGEEMAEAAAAPLLARIPVDPELAKLCDEGNIERYDSDVFTDMSQMLARVLPEPGAINKDSESA